MANTNVKNEGTGRFPIDNLTYDIITLIYEKSKGLEAYDKYMKDAQANQECAQLFQRLRQQDEEAVRELKQHLHKVLGQVDVSRAA